MLETIEKEPEELGYDFGRWTNARLSTYLEEKTGIKLSSGQIRNILKKMSVHIFGQNTAWKKSKIFKREKHLKRN